MILPTILFISALVLGLLGYFEKIRGIKWQRRTLYTMTVIFVLISCSQFALSVFNNIKMAKRANERDAQLKELTDKNKITDTQLDTLKESEFTLKEINVELGYDFHYQKEINSKPSNPRIMKIVAALSSSIKHLKSGEPYLEFHSGMFTEYMYSDPKTVRLMFKLDPKEKYKNQKIDYLSRFKVISIPYSWIINELQKNFSQYILLPGTNLRIAFFVNGKNVANCERSLADIPLSHSVIISTTHGIFRDIRKTYINDNRPENVCSRLNLVQDIDGVASNLYAKDYGPTEMQ